MHMLSMRIELSTACSDHMTVDFFVDQIMQHDCSAVMNGNFSKISPCFFVPEPVARYFFRAAGTQNKPGIFREVAFLNGVGETSPD